MSETRTRFLREIAARIPAERLVEVHLFPAMRQGAVESGIAVVSAAQEPAAEPEMPAANEPAANEPAVNEPEPPAMSGAAPSGDRDDGGSQMAMDELLPADEPACATDDAEPAGDATPIVRHTVYTARYRATLKGPDRGKWEFSLVAEADAPLVTIDAVVRGVQRRSADAAEPERLTPEALQAMDGETWATSTA